MATIMRNIRRFSLFAISLPALAGCASPQGATRTDATPATRAVASESSPEERGLAFARARCSACHAVGAAQLSANPEAPPFEAVVNTPGLTSATLGSWLRNAHNFPEVMNFAIQPDQIDDLASYMLTLKRGS
jgi:mono/diheme cytochrome c family protein